MTDEEIGRLNKKFREIEKRIVEGAINFDATIKALQEIIIEGRVTQFTPVTNGFAEIKMKKGFINLGVVPNTNERYTIKDHEVGNRVISLDMNNIVLVPLTMTKDEEKNNQLYDMGRCTKFIDKKMQALPALNANYLDHLLLYPELIPEDWRYKTILFPKTSYTEKKESWCKSFRALRVMSGNWDDRYINIFRLVHEIVDNQERKNEIELHVAIEKDLILHFGE